MNHIQLLNLRTEFEELASEFSSSVSSGSSINTLEWFAEHGFRSNRLRNGYDRAMEIANIILAEYKNGCTEEIGSRESV